MALGLDDALLSWLVASAGDGVAHWLRGDPARVAMRTVVEEAVAATVATVVGNLDRDRAEHLRDSLLVRNVGLDGDRVRVTNETELRDALHAWTAALDHPEFRAPGYLSGMDVAPGPLADALTSRIAAGIRRNGRAGGALNPLAEWLWRDELSADVSEIKRDLSQLRSVVEPPRLPGGALPGGTPEFIGRQEAMADLAERIEAHDPDGTVVAIHAVDGMAGVGKTELALYAAHQHKHRYPDGQYFINLHGYTEGIAPVPPEAALEELLRQAGVPGQAIPPNLAGRQARWQALMATQRALVLLDNAVDAKQVRALLPMSASCLVLVTSRPRLSGLPGTRALRLDVPPLAEAVELFARVVGTNRHIDPQAATSVVEIVGRLPVAVRTVAGQVADDYTEGELADDLTQAKARASLLEITSPLGTGGLRAAFDTSLERLDQPHRQAFRVLGLHPGPVIGVPQFAALAGLPTAHAHQVLRGLANRHLIAPALDRVGHRRYVLHDLLREYARQQADMHLTVEQQSAAIARLSTWYAAATGVIEGRWDATGAISPTEVTVDGLSVDGPGQARAWLAGEQDNLLAFAEHATGQEAAQLCHRYARRVSQLEFHATARTLYQKAADIYQQTGNRAGEADALWGLGQVARFTSDYPRAKRHYHGALAICRQAGREAGEAAALWGLGEVALLSGDYPGARERHRAALAIYQQTGNRNGEAETLLGLGQVARLTDDHLGAGEHFRAALAIFLQTGNREGEADALLDLGQVARLTDDHPGASQYYRAALAIYQEETGNQNGRADALWGLGRVALLTDDHLGAGEHFRAALAIYQQTGNRNGEAHALTDLGRVAQLTDDHLGAGEHFRAALAIFVQIGKRAQEAYALWGLGLAAKEEGQRNEACERWQKARAIYVEIGSPLAESVQEDLEQLGCD